MGHVNIKARMELLQKAFRKWAVDYHFVIPPAILKQYAHKFFHESSNISKYSVRYFDPNVAEQYNQWLSLQTYEEGNSYMDQIAFVGIGNVNLDGIKVYSVDELDEIKQEYICLVGEGVSFYPAMKNYIGKCKDFDLLYFDNDNIRNGVRCEPCLKPDLSYNTLRGFNYIGNCWVVRKNLVVDFLKQGMSMYRILLELSDMPIQVGHIQKILYCDQADPICGKKDLEAYFAAHHKEVDIKVRTDGISCEVWYHTDTPLISIVIPTKDGIDVLKTCIDSIYEKTTYPNFEIIIADNGSEKEDSLAYFEKLEVEHDNLHVFRIECPFNFSHINNQAVKHAHGEYILMLNNDTSVITPDWLEKMVSYCSQPNVGSVGVLLWYPDDTIQHGGVIIGKGGVAAHRYYRCPHDQKGYMHTLDIPNDVSCCTAACLMVKRTCWEELGGMNEELTVQFNDVDLELRILKAGFYNVFIPEVELYHYESKSRGIDKEKKAVERYVREVEYAKREWADEIKHDPFYNDNFDKNYDYQLIVGSGSN